ncbi:MAG TPA: hypothetical protein HPP80_02955 [Rhodospirillaceae bacterium]|nr:hypothetical protein [Rhodospirillaceae bacterium]
MSKRLVLAAAAAFMIALVPSAWAEEEHKSSEPPKEGHGEAKKPAKGKKGEEPTAKNEIQAKVPGTYLALSKIHLVIEENATGIARSLELEAWLEPADEVQLALARSAKKQIMAALNENLAAYNWEAFKDSKKGIDVAKAVVKETVERVAKAKIEDVIIKTLVLK